MSSPSKSARQIFLEAIESHAPGEWPAFLDRNCGDNAELRSRVAVLLEAHVEEGSLLDKPAVAPAPTIDKPLPVRPGAQIGPYKLLEQIGEGGFGIVFMAEQVEPVRRRVALKVIKPGMDTRQVIARFEAERQALAVMEHPNIAKVLDAGTSESCRPYFVMELVRGTPITQYCDENSLNIRERLALYAAVCLAIQHAHTKGIIHRDIKPTNVLVTRQDGQPVVKVIDFGVAKAMGQQLTEKTLFTEFAQMIGTPLYMSPEQAELSSTDIDTRSDIYSLGVLLYELLTGSTPVSKEQLKQAAFDEIRRIIREDEPQKPSTRISTAKAAPSIAAQRHTEPAKLAKLVRGELDWIVMKALEKDRNRRYETANGLAMDVQRYLADEPVRACPPSAGYRVRKFARRHRRGLAMVTVFAGAILVAVGGVGWMAGDRAAQQAAREQELVRSLDDMEAAFLGGDAPATRAALERAQGLLAGGAVGADLRKRVVGWRTDLEMMARLEQIRLEYAGSNDEAARAVETDAHYAQAFRDYGIDVEGLSFSEAAARLQARPIKVELSATLTTWAARRRGVGRPDRDWQPLLALAEAADPDQWRQQVRDALMRKDREALVRLAASDQVRSLPARTLALLGDTLRASGAVKEAVTLLRQAQQQYPGDFWINYGLGYSLSQLQPPEREEAIRYYTAALALRDDVPVLNLNLGVVLAEKGRWDEAGDAIRKALALKPDLAEAHNSLGVVLAKKDLREDAIRSFEEAIRLKADLVDPHVNLGVALLEKGDVDAGLAAIRAQACLRPDHVGAHRCLAWALWKTDHIDEAITAYQDLVRLEPGDVEAHVHLGALFNKKGQANEALAAYREVICLKPDHAQAHFGLGQALWNADRVDEAVAAYREAIRLNHPNYAEAHVNLALGLRAQGSVKEAIAVYEQALRLKPELVEANMNLASLLADEPDSLQNMPRALQLAERATAVQPGNGVAWATLGMVHYRAADWNAAAQALRRAQDLNGLTLKARFYLAMTNQRLGNKDRARYWYDDACEQQAKFASLDKHQNTGMSQQVERLRDEAAELLGIGKN